MQYHPQVLSGQPAPYLVKLFRYRSAFYKLGFFSLWASFVFFLIGFASAHWVKPVDPESPAWFGLWDIDCELYLCNTSLWIARAFFVFYFATYVVSLGTSIYENARKVDPNSYHSRKLELILTLTGIIGIVALTTWSFLYTDSVLVTKGWSLTITVVSLAVLFVALVILLCANNKPIDHAGRIISLNAQQAQQQVLIQQVPQPMHAQQNHHPPVKVYQDPPRYPSQNFPLIPQPQPNPQPYLSPTAPDAPPPYSMPPAYPGNTQMEYSYPTQSAPVAQISKASAPPME